MTVDQDILVAYVLGGLSPSEEAAVAQHLRAHPDEAAWVRRSFETLAAYALSNAPEAVPDDAETKLLARIQRAPASVAENPAARVTVGGSVVSDDTVADGALEGESKSGEPTISKSVNGEPVATKVATKAESSGATGAEREPEAVEEPGGTQNAPPWTSRTLWLGLATAAAILVLVWLSVFEPRSQNAQIARELETLCANQTSTCQTLTNSQSEPIGTVARRADNSFLVVFDNDPPSDNVYQAWEIVGDTPTSLGTFDSRVVNVTASLPAGSTFGVTLEPSGGSPQPTSTPIALYPLPG